MHFRFIECSQPNNNNLTLEPAAYPIQAAREKLCIRRIREFVSGKRLLGMCWPEWISFVGWQFIIRAYSFAIYSVKVLHIEYIRLPSLPTIIIEFKMCTQYRRLNGTRRVRTAYVCVCARQNILAYFNVDDERSGNHNYHKLNADWCGRRFKVQQS